MEKNNIEKDDYNLTTSRSTEDVLFFVKKLKENPKKYWKKYKEFINFHVELMRANTADIFTDGEFNKEEAREYLRKIGLLKPVTNNE